MTPLQALQAKYGLTVGVDGGRLVVHPQPADPRLRAGIERNRERILDELRERWRRAESEIKTIEAAMERGWLTPERAEAEIVRIARQASARAAISPPCKRCRGRLFWRLPGEPQSAPLICYRCFPPPDRVIPALFEAIEDERGGKR